MTIKMRSTLWLRGKTSWLAAAALLCIMTAFSLWSQRRAQPRSTAAQQPDTQLKIPRMERGKCPSRHLPHSGVCLPLE